MRYFLLALILCTLPRALHSQAANFGAWYSYVGTYDINHRLNIQANTQFRFHNLLGDWNQYLLRTGCNYKLEPKGNFEAGLGIDYFYNEPYLANSDAKTHFNEFRIYEQFISRQHFGRFSFMHRYRLENRFRAESNVLYRLRYFLQTRIAFSKPPIQNKTFYLSILNEAFWNINNANHFDRYWLHTTIGYVLNQHWSIEIGNQTQFMGNGTSNNRLQCWIFHHLRLTDN